MIPENIEKNMYSTMMPENIEKNIYLRRSHDKITMMPKKYILFFNRTTMIPKKILEKTCRYLGRRRGKIKLP